MSTTGGMFAVLKEKVGQVLVPGDEFCFGAEETISLSESAKPERAVCGPGLRRSGDRLVVMKSGVLRHKPPLTFWIDSQQKRVRADRSEPKVLRSQQTAFSGPETCLEHLCEAVRSQPAFKHNFIDSTS